MKGNEKGWFEVYNKETKRDELEIRLILWTEDRKNGVEADMYWPDISFGLFCTKEQGNWYIGNVTVHLVCLSENIQAGIEILNGLADLEVPDGIVGVTEFLQELGYVEGIPNSDEVSEWRKDKCSD